MTEKLTLSMMTDRLNSFERKIEKLKNTLEGNEFSELHVFYKASFRHKIDGEKRMRIVRVWLQEDLEECKQKRIELLHEIQDICGDGIAEGELGGG